MKKIFLFPAVAAMMLTGCGDDDPAPSPSKLTEWSSEVKAEMNAYIGEVLPLVQFNAKTFYHEWDEDEYCYALGDDSDENVVLGYGERLAAVGWAPAVDPETLEVYYTKNTDEASLELHYGWYEETELVAAGNEIVIYVDGEIGPIDPVDPPDPGDEDEPVTGTYTFAMSDAGWDDAGQDDTLFATEVTLAPGLTITPAIGGHSNLAPRYYDTNKELRLYKLNTITFSADKITKIEFTYTSRDSGVLTASTGSFANMVWTGDASSITFSVGDKGQIRITQVVVTGTFSGGGGTPVDPSGGDVDEYVEAIANEIYDALPSEPDYAEVDDGAIFIGLVLSGANSLQTACSLGVNYLPSYLVVYEAMAAGQWDDGSSGYFVTYIDEETSVFVQIGSYEDSGDYVTQYTIY